MKLDRLSPRKIRTPEHTGDYKSSPRSGAMGAAVRYVVLGLSGLMAVLPVRAETVQGEALPDAAAAEVALPTLATAPTLRFSGYGTLGYVHSSASHDWKFARDLVQPGATNSGSTLVDSRLGLQLNWTPSPDIDGVVQGVLRKRPSESKPADVIEWAFMAWRPTDATTLRAGRISPDLFLFAESRNLGHALPWVRPNVETYGWLPFTSMDGADAQYRWRSGDADWQFRAAAGTASLTVQSLWEGLGLRARSENTAILTLSREEGPLLLKAAWMRTRFDLASSSDTAMVDQYLRQLANDVQPFMPDVASMATAAANNTVIGGQTTYATVGVQYDTGPWLLLAEASRARMAHGKIGGTRGHVTVGHRWSQWTVYGTLARSRSDRAAAVAPDLATPLSQVVDPATAQQAQMLADVSALIANATRFSQRTLSLGARWDVHPRAALKLQFDRTLVDQAGAANWQHGTPDSGAARVVSATLDFVF